MKSIVYYCSIYVHNIFFFNPVTLIWLICNQIVSKLYVICCSRKLTNISSEENNFLVVVLGFKKIIYPVIKNHFNAQCSDDVLNQMHMHIYEEETAQHCDSLPKDEIGSRKNRLFLTEIEKRQLFSPNSEFVIFYTYRRLLFSDTSAFVIGILVCNFYFYDIHGMFFNDHINWI